jgi:hypothetical protein
MVPGSPTSPPWRFIRRPPTPARRRRPSARQNSPFQGYTKPNSPF